MCGGCREPSCRQGIRGKPLSHAPCSSLSTTFPSGELATIACNSLAADREPRKQDVVKTLTTDGPVLTAYVVARPRSLVIHSLISSRLTERRDFKATEMRFLRTAVSSYIDFLQLTTRTMIEFGPTGAQVLS